MNTISAVFIDLHVGQINQRTLGAALTSCCSGVPWFSMLLSSSMSDALCAYQLFFAMIWIFQITILLKSTFGVRNTSRYSSLITGGWMAVNFCDSADNKYLSLSSREVLCPHSWWQRWSFRQFKCSCIIIWKVEQGALTIASVSEIYSTDVTCLFLAWVSFCAVCRFSLFCHIWRMLWTLAIPCNAQCSTSLFISNWF